MSRLSEKLNIAFLLGRVSAKGGISRVTSILTKELEETNIYNKIHIISYHKREKFEYGWSNKLVYHDLLLDRSSMRKGIFKSSVNLRKMLKANNIDVLIAAGHNMGPLAVISSWFIKTKIVYWSHSSYKASTNSKYRRINEKITAIFSKCVVSLTKADQINYTNDTLAQRVEQIYNPVDPILNKLDRTYNPNSKLIISVGRLTHQKNFVLLVDIAKIVLEKHKDYTWHIFGSGEDEAMIQKKISEYNLDGRLVLMGQSNDLYHEYSKYSMMVMTSRYEGFPMTLIEGMACKLPLISFNIPTGPNEIIKENINGFLISPFDINKMADKIQELISNENIRNEFSNANRKLIKSFEIESIINKWTELIESTME